jgi:diguanylate cyclase (GGDEF)-like protein
MSQVNTALNAFDSWAEFASAAIEEVDALSEFIGVPSWVRPESREVLATAIARQDGARGEMERALPPRTASIWSAATITPRYVAYEDQRGRVLQIAGVSGTGPVPSVTSEKEIAARAELVVSSVERIGVIAELSPVLTADVADAASVVSASVRRSFDQAIAGAAIAGLVSLLFGVFVIRSIVRPLRHLEHQATQLRSGARHVGRMGAGGPAEIAVVGQALDEVVEYLAILEAQAEALAAGDVEADVLAHDGPGDLALSLKQSVRNLSAITERLRHQARHDQLTGLLNRAAAIQALEALLDDARRAEADVTLFFLDLDRFKLVNDTNGHEAGDYVLTEIAHRLRWLASDAVIARHGGDEFVVITTDGTPARSAELAEAMIQAIERPFMFAGVEHQLSASVGISRAPAGDATALKMLREADHAVYQAKERPGSGQVATFDEHTRRSADRRTRTEDDLRRAIEDDELDLHYQPIVSVTTGEILGVEALLRWPHPTRGLLVPDQFIPIADDSRLAIELGRWVLRAALGQAKAWKDEFGELPGRVGVNLSRRHLLAGVVTDVRAACAEQDAESAWLSLEIPESHLTADIESARRVFEELRDIGVGISIDEFGTGASALTQLRRLPVDTVKMDRALVRLLAAPDGDRAIVDAILTLASVFDLRVVAVGVETELQRDRLAALGCHGMQGWLVSTVLSADAMTAWLRDVEVVSLP